MDGDFIYKNLKELFNNLETFNILVMFRRVTLSHLPLEFGNKVKKKSHCAIESMEIYKGQMLIATRQVSEIKSQFWPCMGSSVG